MGTSQLFLLNLPWKLVPPPPISLSLAHTHSLKGNKEITSKLVETSV